MIFRTLYIKNFKKLHDVTMDLTDGINIVTGDNESGKSTVCDFIRFIFYGLPQKVKAEEKQAYISWESGTASGYIVFSDGGHEYRAEREAVMTSSADGKLSFSEKSAVVDMAAGKICFRGEIPGEHFFGIPETVFDSTAYVHQLGESKIGGKTLGESVENILFSADESTDTKKALEKIEKARRALWHANKGGGLIYNLTKEKEKKESELETALAAGSRILYLEGRKRELGEAAEKAEADADRVQEEFNRYERYTIKRTFKQCEEERREKAALEARLASLSEPADGNNSIGSPAYLLKLRGYEQDLKLAEARKEDGKKEMEESRRKLGSMNEKLSRFGKIAESGEKRDRLMAEARKDHARFLSGKAKTVVAFVLTLLFGFLTAGASLIGKEVLPSYMPTVFLCLTLLAFLLLGLFFALTVTARSALAKICRLFGCSDYAELDELARAAESDEAVMVFFSEAKDAAEERYSEAGENLATLVKNVQEELISAGFAPGASVFDTLSRAIAVCEARQKEITELKLQIDAKEDRASSCLSLLSRYSDEQIAAAREEKFSVSEMESFDVQKKKKDLEFLRRSALYSRDSIHEIEKEYSVLLATSHNPAAIAPEKEILEAQIETLTEKYEAYRLAYDSIAAASGKLRDGLSPKLAAAAGNVMSKFSDGKYKKLGVDSDFSMNFFDGATHGVDSLSAGTADLAYLSLRIALLNVLCPDTRPPFIFDESFSRLDDKRLASALSLLFRLYGGGAEQCLVFTCHGREEATMKKIGKYNAIRL